MFTDVVVLSSGHNVMLAQECSEETRHQQWDGSPRLDQPTPSGLEGRQDKRSVLEALHTHQQQHIFNLDCGLAIDPSWLSLLDKPTYS